MASSQYDHLIHFVEDHALIFTTEKLIHLYFLTAAVAFKSIPRLALLARKLVAWQVM